VLIGVVLLVLAGLAIYRLLIWGMSGPPTDQTTGFNAVLGTTTRSLVEDDRGIVGPSEQDIEEVNRD